MALRLKTGTVINQADVTQTGKFMVSFKISDGEGYEEEPVRYVTPYGNTEAAFVAIPMVGSQILCAYEDDVASEGDRIKGYYYLGSLMGDIPGANDSLPTPPPGTEAPPSNDYVPKDKTGTFGPETGEFETAMQEPEKVPSFPSAFKDMYDGKGIIPEAIGLSNHRGDAFKISSQYDSVSKSKDPFQNYAIGMQSGSGKQFKLIDSPIVNGIVMTNEHKGKDYFIWSSTGSKDSPFAAGEYHMRTHGPVNMYTLANRFHMWVEDGLNVEIENKSTGKAAYGDDTSSNSDGRVDALGNPATGLGDPGIGGYSTRKGVFGNETTGCIKLRSHHNNISLEAEAQDSVIFVNAPGPHSRVIVESGGSVDIVAKGKITLQSDVEIEITAPEVDINGSNIVDINGTDVTINGGPNINLNPSPGYVAPAS